MRDREPGDRGGSVDVDVIALRMGLGSRLIGFVGHRAQGPEGTGTHDVRPDLPAGDGVLDDHDESSRMQKGVAVVEERQSMGRIDDLSMLP